MTAFDWHDVTAVADVVKMFTTALGKRTEDLKKLAAIACDENEAEARREAAFQEIERLSDAYIADSLQAMQMESFDALARRMDIQQQLARMFYGLKGEAVPETTTTTLEAYKTTPERAVFIASVVWPHLVRRASDDLEFVTRYGHTLESWSKLTMKERDQVYAKVQIREPQPRGWTVDIRHADGRVEQR